MDKSLIVKLVEEKLIESYFLVDCTVSSQNKITVLVDSPEGVSIDFCVAISRHIESHLDREQEDFELVVSSPGLDHPFVVLQQYQKNIGKEVEVVLDGGEKVEGTLVAVSDNQVEVEVTKRVRVEGKKKKQTITEVLSLPFSNIKHTKSVIKFK